VKPFRIRAGNELVEVLSAIAPAGSMNRLDFENFHIGLLKDHIALQRFFSPIHIRLQFSI
jgi:hypothetical protein